MTTGKGEGEGSGVEEVATYLRRKGSVHSASLTKLGVRRSRVHEFTVPPTTCFDLQLAHREDKKRKIYGHYENLCGDRWGHEGQISFQISSSLTAPPFFLRAIRSFLAWQDNNTKSQSP